MINKTIKNAFTFIEILVVVTIIGLLAAGAAVSYSRFSKQSRDAKRKTDLEQIRAALEMYKSNNNAYPATLTLTISCTSPAGLQDPSPGTNVYLNQIPSDPKCSTATNTPNYTYSSNTTSYTISAALEDGTTYTLNPYGQQ